MESRFYKDVFPRTRLNPKKSTEAEFETTRRGYRLSSSIGGTLTGRGGDMLIVDDPVKAIDANSELALAAADEWFHSTALTRLDSENSLVIVAMQRLHQRDLSGIQIEKGWPCIVLPAVATGTQTYRIAEDETYTRPVGELLQPQRDSREAMEAKQRELGSRIWAAQFQQNPTPPEGDMIKASWLARYDFPPAERKFRRVVLCCDPAGKAGPRNDYTAITICGFDRNQIHVLHVARGHWTVMQMRDRIVTLAREWNVDLAIIEDISSGMGLIQILRAETSLDVIGRHPDRDKVTRMSRHEGRFEAGNILLPKEALWLADFEAELLAFPNGRHDDLLDSLLLLLDWFQKRERWDTHDLAGYSGPLFYIGGEGWLKPVPDRDSSETSQYPTDYHRLLC
jgi:predicted phage terminase large subunit-like protein